MIEKDFKIISSIYDRVIVVVPAENTSLYFRNLKVINDIAREFKLGVLYAIFPGEKYGREDTYLTGGTQMHNLVVEDMEYMVSLKATYKIALWYGWKYRCDAQDIVRFYDALPSSLKDIYAVWLDEEYVDRVVSVYSEGLPHNVLFITEVYDKDEIASYSNLYYEQMLVTGYEGARSLGEWKEKIEFMLSDCEMDNIGIWIFYDKGDGSGEEYGAYINGSLIPFSIPHYYLERKLSSFGFATYPERQNIFILPCHP